MTERQPCVVYLRVSTKRQAEAGTSLNDQKASTTRAAASLGYFVAATYIDGGKSGRSDQRAEFQRMIADCCSKTRPYRAIIIHDFSRFFRDDFEIEAYRRKLEKNGVELISATQPIAAGPHARLQRAVITAMDAASSDITAARVSSVMRTNASESFWNGSTPPLGYETYTAEIRGKKHKKKLRIVPAEAAQVQTVVDRYLGRGGVKSVGLAKLAKQLNDEGLSHRGSNFTPNLVHTILSRQTYVGRHYYGVSDSRTRKIRPREEWIEVTVPAIISEADFALVQKKLKSRDPKMSPARSHSSPVLLSGLGRCGKPGCTGTMMLMTGKGGQYSYYACSNARRKKDYSCGGNNISMPLVDKVVVDALLKRLLKPERLNTLLARLLEKSEGADAKRRQTIGTLRAERTGIETAIQHLFEMAEAGAFEATDKDFKGRLQKHQKRRSAIDEEIRIIDRQLGSKSVRVNEATIARFAGSLKAKLADPNDVELRKSYIRAFVSEVVMTKEQIIIRGPVAALSRAVTADDSDDPPVRSSVVDWCALQDSNLRPQD